MNAWAEIALIALSVLLAAFASGAETAVVSCSKVRLRTRAKAGEWRARVLERLVASPEHFLSIVLVATNLGVIVCTAAATSLAVRLFATNGAAIATAVVVPLLLIVADVIPKSVFLYHADRVATAVAPLLRFLGYALWPLVAPATFLVRLLVRASGADAKRFNVLSTREELVYLYRVGKTEGDSERRERLIIDRVFRVGSVRAKDLMIPMARVVSVDAAASIEEVVEEANRHTYSRLPVVLRPEGRIVGIVSLFDLLGLDGGEALASVMHPPLVVKETETAERLLVALKDEGMHMAVVAGERGETRGIVTLETVLESIVGDIRSGFAAAPPPAET